MMWSVAEVYLVGANIYGSVKSAEVQQSAPVTVSETLNLRLNINNQPADFSWHKLIQSSLIEIWL